MAHRRQKPRFGQISAFGPAPRFVRIELGLFEFGDERVFFGLKGNVARRRLVQAMDDDQEIADDADSERGSRQRGPMQTGGVEDDRADDHRQHPRYERRRNRCGQKRHHGRDEKHHDNGEGLRIRLARLEKRHDEIGPGRAAKAGREHEFAPPSASVLVGVDAVEERDRQSIDDQDRADDEGRPRRQRPGAEPRQRRPAHSQRDHAHHRRSAAVDFGEQPNHRGRMGGDRVGLGERLACLPEPDVHLAATRRRLGVALAPGSRHLRLDFTHDRPTRNARHFP